MQHFSEKLFYAINARKMRVEDFAAKINKTRGGIYAMAKRKKLPPKLIEKIDKILNLTPEFWDSPLQNPPLPGQHAGSQISDVLFQLRAELDSIKLLLESKDRHIKTLEDLVHQLKLERHNTNHKTK